MLVVVEKKGFKFKKPMTIFSRVNLIRILDSVGVTSNTLVKIVNDGEIITSINFSARDFNYTVDTFVKEVEEELKN